MVNVNTKTQLAIFGGAPVRDKPYPVHDTMLDKQERDLLNEVLDSGVLSGFAANFDERFHGGRMVKQLEQEICKYFKVKHAVTFNSATSALQAALAAARIGPGDEVITSPFTMTATPSSILMNNAIPIFADIENRFFCIEPNSIKESLSPRTKALLVVDLCGQPAQLDAIMDIARDNNLVVIEDASHAISAKYKGKFVGTIGDMGIFSFNYHKIIQTGEGGVVVTDNDDYAYRLELIRNHGEVIVPQINLQDIADIVGYNYRMTEMQAAVGIGQLKKLDLLIRHKRELAQYLTEQLVDFPFLTTPEVRRDSTHTFYIYMLRYDESYLGIKRDVFAEVLASEGVWLRPGYSKPLYLLPLYQELIAYGKQGCPFKCNFYSGKAEYRKGLCPVAERLYEKEILYTIMCKFPLKKEDMLEISQAIEKVVDNQDLIKKRLAK